MASIFLIPVIISAYLGGLGPGLLSTALGVLCARYFLTSPCHSLRISNQADYLRLGSVLVIGVLISALSESLRRARAPQESDASVWVPVDRKVRWTFGFAAICLLAIGVVSYRAVNALRVNDEWVDHTHRVLLLLNGLLGTTTDAETGVRGYVITGTEQYLEPYNSAIASVPVMQHELRVLTGDDPAQQRNLDSLDVLVSGRVSLLRQTVELRRTRDFAAATSNSKPSTPDRLVG